MRREVQGEVWHVPDLTQANRREMQPRSSGVGLAPVLIHASTHEVLADDAVALAARIAECGGRVQLDMWPQMTHVWHAMIPHVPESVAAVADVRLFIERVLT